MRGGRPERIVKAFFELVRCGLWDTEPQKSLFEGLNSENWTELYKLTAEQAVIGICFPPIEKLPAELRPPRQLLLSWFGKVEYIRDSNRRMGEAIVELNNRFEQQGIYPILMKGLGFASFYKDPGLRMTGDIDLYIPTKYKEVVALVKSWGYEVIYMPQHDKFCYNGFWIELHHDWINPPCLPMTPAYMVTSTECQMNYRIPGGEANSLLLLTHALRHLMGPGVGVRHVCDWALFLQNNHLGLDTDDIKKQIEAIGIRRFVSAFTALAASHLGLNISVAGSWIADTEDKYAGILLNDILINGDCGRLIFIKREKAALASFLLLRTYGWIHYYAMSLFRLIRLRPFWPDYVWRIVRRRFTMRIKFLMRGNPFAIK